MTYPEGLKYTPDHEWVEIVGERARVGITDYAQEQLGDVVYIELPDVGTSLQHGQSFGTIESVKAVSELYAPVSGRVVQVNAALKEKPEGVKTSPYTSWLIEMEPAGSFDLDGLLDAAQYAALVATAGSDAS